MNRNVFILSLMVLSSYAVAAEEKKTIYKYTDENGVTHYSETKPNDDYKEADLPQLSVVPSTPIKATSDSSSSRNDDEFQDPAMVSEFKILAPSNEENIWGSGNTVTAKVTELTELQQEVYTIQFAIDGKKQKPAERSTQTFKEVYRGEHTIQAFLLNKYTQKEVKKSDKVTFFIHQKSIQ